MRRRGFEKIFSHFESDYVKYYKNLDANDFIDCKIFVDNSYEIYYLYLDCVYINVKGNDINNYKAFKSKLNFLMIAINKIK